MSVLEDGPYLTAGQREEVAKVSEVLKSVGPITLFVENLPAARSYYVYGPLLYDLASAVMYVGGQDHAGELVQAYLRKDVLDLAEVQAGLASMLRFRWAVQADYFAWRIAENDLTGISGPQDNEKGLEDARRSLTF